MMKKIGTGFVLILLAYLSLFIYNNNVVNKYEKNIIQNEFEKMGVTPQLIGDDEQWKDFILHNSAYIQQILIYLDSGNLPKLNKDVNVLTDNVSYNKIVKKDQEFMNNTYEFIFYSEEVDTYGSYNIIDIYQVIDPDDVVYKFLDYYLFARGITYKNGMLIMEFQIGTTGIELKYTGGLDGEIDDFDNWSIIEFGYGV